MRTRADISRALRESFSVAPMQLLFGNVIETWPDGALWIESVFGTGAVLNIRLTYACSNRDGLDVMRASSAGMVIARQHDEMLDVLEINATSGASGGHVHVKVGTWDESEDVVLTVVNPLTGSTRDVPLRRSHV